MKELEKKLKDKSTSKKEKELIKEKLALVKGQKTVEKCTL